MRRHCSLALILGGCALLISGSAVCADIELGQPVGEFTVLDARDEPLTVKATPERTATALVFLSARSDAVDASLEAISRLYRKAVHRAVVPRRQRRATDEIGRQDAAERVVERHFFVR